MITASVQAAYADVFQSTTVDSGMVTLCLSIAGIGVLILLGSMFLTFSDESFPVMMTGFVIAMGGIIFLCFLNLQATQAAENVRKNMISNVQEKYEADLQLPKYYAAKDLDKFQTYTLKFEDGAKGEYELRFEKDGEPTLAEKAKAPSVEELNSETEPTTEPTSSLKSPPTSTELEESAK